MAKNKSKLVFMITIVILILGLFSGCNERTMPPIQPTDTEANTTLTSEEVDLVGFWHAMHFVASGYAERISFYEDRNYKFLPNSMSTENNDWGSGKWSVKENKLYLVQERKSEGELLETPIEIEIAIGPIENAYENAAYPYKVKIGEDYYWKMSDDPDFNTEVETQENNTHTTSDDGDKLINSNNISDSDKMDSWLGNYSFSENVPPDQNMFYGISIEKEADKYYAKLSIDGFQTMTRLKASISGNENAIEMVFESYLPDNVFEPYEKGDILLKLEEKDSKLYTIWGEITPIVESNLEPGTYFTKEISNSTEN